MRQKQRLENSLNESSHSPDFSTAQGLKDAQLAKYLYDVHMDELGIKKDMYNDHPEMLKLGSLQSEALVASIVHYAEEHDLNLSAMDIEEVIKILLEKIAYDESLHKNERARHADFIEQLMKIANMLRFFELHILPYSRI